MAKGFKHGAGGVDLLNFQVVGGTTEPGNPKQNTIWFNTDKEITCWVFSYEEPGAPVEGMVWASTGVLDTASFNALKKNTLQIYPMQAQQYLSGAWVKVAAMSYLDGAWIAWWDGTCFDNGNQYITYTGGWKAVNGAGASASIGSSAISFSVTGASNRQAAAFTNNKIDVTGYNTLRVTGDIAITVSFSVGLSSDNTQFGPPLVASKSLNGNTTVDLDISSVEGEYYIALVMNRAAGSVTHVQLLQ